MGLRYVIAGESQCNIFAEICLVADRLAQYLPNFCYDRIEKSVADWKPWLCKMNQKNKWNHIGSPIVWKELLMPGSKPSYIGSAPEFLEYCYTYYNFDAFLTPKRFENLVDNYGQFQKKYKEEYQTVDRPDHSNSIEKAANTSFTVCISGAGNPLALFIISGLLENSDKISKIYLYDEKCSQSLMEFVELECNYIGTNTPGKLVKYIEKIGVGLTGADLLIILDFAPFRSQDSIGEWLYQNKKIMQQIAVNINATASSKMLVMLPNLGPACYNASILAQSVTKIKKKNIVVTTSDLGFEVAPIIAEIAEVPLRNMFCPPVWGFVGINHLVDIYTTVHKYYSFNPYERYSRVINSTLPIGTLTPEMRTMEYLMFQDESLWKIVADRKVQKKMADYPISINKAIAVLNLVNFWIFHPKPNCMLNLGIQCNGTFGLTFNGVFSQPAHLINGEWQPASKYMLPRDPQIKIHYLQQIAEIVMTFNTTDLPQLVSYTPCICKVKKPQKNKQSKFSSKSFKY